MNAHTMVAAALVLNAVLGFGYRVYRLSKGGSVGDVYGQAVLGVVLLGLAAGVSTEAGWAPWGAFVYGVVFGLAVMPVWVLAVLLPQSPGAPDYLFTAVYWTSLVTIAVGALAI